MPNNLGSLLIGGMLAFAVVIGMALMVIGAVKWFVGKFQPEARVSVSWIIGTIMCFALLGGGPLALAMFVSEHRAWFLLATLVGLCWSLGLALIVRQLLRPEPTIEEV